MPSFFEIYGKKADAQINRDTSKPLIPQCPFTNAICDGGGNRHQTKINLTKESELSKIFDPSVSSVIPGICSIAHGSDNWIVCPRRLLGFSKTGDLKKNATLQSHEKAALIAAGVPVKKELGVWSEVYLKFSDDDSSINYHFDFVIAEILKDASIEQALEWSNESEKISFKLGRTNKKSNNSTFPILPNLISEFFIIEVMTASTSGSDKSAGTDISSSFRKAVLGENYECPGINKRQVWGRMATQLFAKTALADYWGGKTIWLLQDQLIKNIELTTKLKIKHEEELKTNSINFLTMKYKGNTNEIIVDSYTKNNIGFDFGINNGCVDILLPKKYPQKSELLKSILRSELIAVIEL